MIRLMVSIALFVLVGGALAVWAVRDRGDGSRPAAAMLNFLLTGSRIQVEKGIAYGRLARQRLDIYRPRAEPHGPVVLFLHGGGWTSGSRGDHGFVGATLAARGLTVVIPDYRLYPEARFPDFVEDAALAYRWAAPHCQQHGISRPLFIMGHSAGAHIGALLTYDPDYRARFAPGAVPPQGFVGLAGPYAFDPTTWPASREIFTTAAENADRARPVAFAGRGVGTPSLLLYGRGDKTVGRFNQLDFVAALRDADVGVHLREYPSVGHVAIILALLPVLRSRAPVLDDILAFLEDETRKASALPAGARNVVLSQPA
jgi:acetyl esterase/lipase